MSRIHLSMADKSTVLIQKSAAASQLFKSKKDQTIEEKLALLMVKNSDLKPENPTVQEASNQLMKKQVEAISSIAVDYLTGKETEVTFDQAVSFFDQNSIGLSGSNRSRFDDNATNSL